LNELKGKVEAACGKMAGHARLHESRDEKGRVLAKGDLVERMIDDQLYKVTIEAIDYIRCVATVKYVDDGNIEENVMFDEIKFIVNSAATFNPFNIMSVFNIKETIRKSETLLKPLKGLIEDDSDDRIKHVPTVTIHQTVETEEAIIINGQENKLAAGNGLRALRYLKPS